MSVALAAAAVEVIPFDIPEGAELYADPAGFAIVRGPVEEVPESIHEGGYYEVGTSILIEPVNRIGRADPERTRRVPHGTYHMDWGPLGYESGSVFLRELFPTASGALAMTTDRSSSSVSYAPSSGSTSTLGLAFRGAMVDGSSETTFGLQGNRGDFRYEWRGFPLRKPDGGIRYGVVEFYHKNGDFWEGIPPLLRHRFLLVEDEGPGLWVDTDHDPDPEEVAGLAAGSSLAVDARVVFAGSSGGIPQYWRIGEAGLDTGWLLDFPAEGVPLAAAESTGGELLVLLDVAGELAAWSSTEGLTALGAFPFPEGRSGWFDEAGGCHFYSGALPVVEEVPLHLWRSPAGEWRTQDLGALAGAEEEFQRAAFDMTRMAGLRVGLHTRGTVADTIRVLRFHEGSWTAEVIDESGPGSTFADLRVGGIAGDDFLAVYRVEDAAKQDDGGLWRAYLETGTLATAASDAWRLYR